MTALRIRALLLAALTTLSVASVAQAQATCLITGPAGTCNTTATTALTVPTILRLTIGSGTTSFGTITAAAYNFGSTDIAGPSVVVKANQAWRVQISSPATFWTAVNTDGLNPARTTKPLSDLRWGPAVGGSFTVMSGTGAQVGSGGRTGGTTIPLAFRSMWSYTTDTPGNYSVSVTFTLLSP